MLLYDSFDTHFKIYCICLKERDDRYQQVCAEFKKMGIFEKIMFYRPDPDPIGTSFSSTLACLNHALIHDPLKNILIFEDDVCFLSMRFLRIAFNEWFIYSQTEWDTIRLGYWKGIFIENLDGVFYRGNCRAAHAIIYSPWFARKLLDDTRTYKEKGIIDQYLSHVSGRHYLLKNAVCYQRPGFTSNLVWPDKNVQANFLENPIQFQLKYQTRTHMAWEFIGKYLPKFFGIRGYAQMLIVMEWSELWNIFRKGLGYYIFNNKCLI